MTIFQRLNDEQGITVVFVTHDPEIAGCTRRIIRLHDGTIESDETNESPTSGPPCGVVPGRAPEGGAA
jgi:putative ABC transport system ATP-binding protein